MSEEDNATITVGPDEELVDPIEVLVRDWVTDTIKNELGEGYEGVNISFEDLGTVILTCFDEIQKAMLASIVPKDTIIH